MIMMAPDGYYTYLQVPKSNSSTNNNNKGESNLDIDLIRKNYRKLSIKHHPDKPGGDVETFRLLKRAQTVLSSPKLRQQYDILGLDLDDDEDHNRSDGEGAGTEGGAAGDDGGEPQTTSQGIIQDIASSALVVVLQLCVRTAMMGAVSVFVTRYRLLLLPALAILAFVAYRIHVTPGSSSLDVLSPFLIGTGLILMYQSSSWSDNGEDGTGSSKYWLLYWIGESLVIFMFTYNSLGAQQLASSFAVMGIGAFGLLAALWFRGKFWNYVMVIGLELFLALFITISFPVFEMILEAILNDKLKKVGDKVRAHHEYMERYYQNKAKEKK